MYCNVCQMELPGGESYCRSCGADSFESRNIGTVEALSRIEDNLIDYARNIVVSKKSVFRTYSNIHVDMKFLPEDFKNFLEFEGYTDIIIEHEENITVVTDRSKFASVIVENGENLSVYFKILISANEFIKKGVLEQAANGKGRQLLSNLLWLGGESAMRIGAKTFIEDALFNAKSKEQQVVEIEDYINTSEREMVIKLCEVIKERALYWR